MSNIKVTWKFDTFEDLKVIVLCGTYYMHLITLSKLKNLHVDFIVQNYICKSDSREKISNVKDENDLRLAR